MWTTEAALLEGFSKSALMTLPAFDMRDIDSIASPPGELNDPIVRMRKLITTRATKLKPIYNFLRRSNIKNAVVLGIVTLLLNGTGAAQDRGPLPDWSGVWAMNGGTVFDRATIEGRGGSNTPGVREHPPYNPEYEAKYVRNLQLRDDALFPDPISNCGIPSGFPRIMNIPDVYEFAVTPRQVWIVTENGPGILRIYTDGRDHPAPEDLWPTHTGDSVGHWQNVTRWCSTRSVSTVRKGGTRSSTVQA